MSPPSALVCFASKFFLFSFASWGGLWLLSFCRRNGKETYELRDVEQGPIHTEREEKHDKQKGNLKAVAQATDGEESKKAFFLSGLCKREFLGVNERQAKRRRGEEENRAEVVDFLSALSLVLERRNCFSPSLLFLAEQTPYLLQRDEGKDCFTPHT